MKRAAIISALCLCACAAWANMAMDPGIFRTNRPPLGTNNPPVTNSPSFKAPAQKPGNPSKSSSAGAASAGFVLTAAFAGLGMLVAPRSQKPRC
jgi:hypothetical protein